MHLIPCTLFLIACFLRLPFLAAWVQSNNILYDSLEDLSDREAPEEPNARVLATAIMRETLPIPLR